MKKATCQITGLLNSPLDFSLLLDEIPFGISVVDPVRRIVLLNRAMEGLTGFARRDAEGIPCAHILRSNICFDGCPLLKGKSFSEPVSLEGDIVNRDRLKIPVRINFSPLKDSHGNTVGYLETVEDIRALRTLGAKISKAYGFGQIVGQSPQMERVFQILPIIAQSDSTVLITGETGTGKDFVAEAIHQASSQARDPFIKINCGALPETLMESELFGHQKGAFTGAVESKPGRFRLAHNGTLYLTEIGDLPLGLQVKLLTFLDDKVIYPLGSTKGFQVNVRLIAATHRNLERMVRQRLFREDLLFRLNVVRLQLPPLRERGDDVRLLLKHFLHSFVSQLQKPLKGFSAKAMRLLQEYPYPGNVRELKNIVEYAVNICQEDQIAVNHLPAYISEPGSAGWSVEPETGEAQPAALDTAKPEEGTDGELSWDEMERKMITQAMMKSKGRRGKAAELLGWGRSTLWRKMKHYGLD
ncbi:MAG: sigma-54 interaction domain-containing protein [Syntrophobacteraceae bacterium]